MTPPLADAPLTPLDPGRAAALRQALVRAGYTSAGLAEAFNVEDAAEVLVYGLPPYLPTLPDRRPLETLLRLFMVGLPQPQRDVDHALAPLSSGELAAAGLVTLDGSDVRAAVKLVVYEGLYFLCDLTRDTGRDIPPNFVTGVTANSMSLNYFTVRRPVESVLDVGTGCGIQALLAARHAQRVVASDVNRRALNLAAFSAALNGLAHVEFREGSFFDPVGDEMFDLVVSNPPYVVSPDSAFLYRDSGMPADTVSEHVVKEAVRRLRDGGYAHVLADWVTAAGGDPGDTPRRWLESSGCDAIVLAHRTEEPLSYASRWVAQVEPDPAEFRDAVARWLRYYEENGIEELSAGALIMRRSRRPENWLAVYRTPPRDIHHCGDQLARLFRVQDFLHDLSSPRDLLEQRLTPLPGHTVEKVEQWEPGDGYRLTSATVHSRQGLDFTMAVDQGGVEVLRRCDGRAPLRKVVTALSNLFRAPGEDLEPPVLAVARDLIEIGVLAPEGL